MHQERRPVPRLTEVKLVEVLLTLRAMRMMRLVRLRLRTSLLVLARLTTSSAVARKGASSAAARAAIHPYNHITAQAFYRQT